MAASALFVSVLDLAEQWALLCYALEFRFEYGAHRGTPRQNVESLAWGRQRIS